MMDAYNNKYNTILFDLDGTLTDPKTGITKSVQYALKSFDIIIDDLYDLDKFIGPPLNESFIEYYGFNETQAASAVDKYREYFSVKGIYENILYPGIYELVNSLVKYGKVLVLATSKPTVFAERILDHFKLKNMFSFIAGSGLDGSRARKEDILRYILNEMKCENNAGVIMVGDRKYDIIGANEVGIDSVGVLYGYGTLEELREENATYVVDSVKDLGDLLLR
jgi:phosphoglycolate phosphatase